MAAIEAKIPGARGAGGGAGKEPREVAGGLWRGPVALGMRKTGLWKSIYGGVGGGGISFLPGGGGGL